jgi:cation transport regulator ChaC
MEMMPTAIITDVASYDYIFGFGSIINTETHAPWLTSSSSTSTVDNNSTTGSSALPGQRATLQANLGYQRGWNFRSNTGFTALGVMPTKNNGEEVGSDINGVLFRIPRSMIEAFDRREVGYDRVELPRDGLVARVVVRRY